jgi:VWFA-related protein
LRRERRKDKGKIMPQGKWNRGLLWLPTVVAGAGLCFAQGRPKSKGQQPAPTIHVVSRLVNVSVVIRDKHGHPITDLSRKDFTIYDGGRKQTIAFFRLPGVGPAASLPSAAQPDVYSNAGQAAVRSRGLTIILLDGLNTPFLDQEYARTQVIRFLKQIQPGDRVALYALGTKLSIIHDFTSSTATLLAALNRYQSGLNSTMQKGTDLQQVTVPTSTAGPAGAASSAIAAEVAQLNVSIQQATEVTQAFARNNRQVMTLEALNRIARHVADVPGRKNLIWVVGDLPYCLCQNDKELDPDFYYKAILGTEQLLSSVNVAVYPVDARGLFGFGLGFVTGSNGPATKMPGQMPGSHFAMEEAAKVTGGLAFFNTNDIMGAIHRAVDDADSSYLLSYYPNHDDWKGEFRKLRVKVDQRGLKVRTRSGYYATPSLAGQITGAHVSLAQIAVRPIEATGIRFGVRVVPRPSKTGRTVEAIVKFDPHGMQFTAGSDGETAKLEYGFFQEDVDGSLRGVQQQSIGVVVSQAAYEKGMKEGMWFSVVVPLRKAASTLVIVLRDQASGTAGSVRIPLAKYQPGSGD